VLFAVSVEAMGFCQILGYTESVMGLFLPSQLRVKILHQPYV
jgi:hypothetical protein